MTLGLEGKHLNLVTSNLVPSKVCAFYIKHQICIKHALIRYKTDAEFFPQTLGFTITLAYLVNDGVYCCSGGLLRIGGTLSGKYL